MSDKKLKIALFIGSDITSHLIAWQISDWLEKNDHEPYLFYVMPQDKSKTPKHLKALQKYERNIWPQVFNGLTKGTPTTLSKRFFVAKIDQVNSLTISRFLTSQKITHGVSIRCYQKFSSGLIRYFKDQQRQYNNFVNLHPGLLPQYRGVFTYARAMQNQEERAGFTLHKINDQWDAGPTLASANAQLDYKKSALRNMLTHIPIAVELLQNYFTKATSGEPITSLPQTEAEAIYYTHLTATEHKQLQKQHINLVDPQSDIDWVLQNYYHLPPQNLIAFL